MRVLVATPLGQGIQPNDFNFVPDGELLFVRGSECDRDKGNPDGQCGCARSFVGSASGKGTTTALVVSTVLSYPEVLEIVQNRIMASSNEFYGDDPHYAALEAVHEITEVTMLHDAGTVLERRGNLVRVRDFTALYPVEPALRPVRPAPSPSSHQG